MPILIETTIQQYTNAIISGEIPTPKGSCPRCFVQPKAFTLHECRRRSFRFIVGNFVKVIMSLIPRWKCSACGQTFTLYPPFALPHKRYVLVDIERLSRKYIEAEQHTYRTTVTHEGAPIGYQEENGRNVDHFLDPSTPWRWIQWLGNTNRKADQLVDRTGYKARRRPARGSPIFASDKHRRSHRQRFLQTAEVVLHVPKEFQ